MIITVPERGTTSLSPREWTHLSSDARFWHLIEANIVQVEAGSGGKWNLKGTCYVGRALIGQTVLQISEKFPNAFETLVRLGVLKSPRTLRVASPVAASTGSTPVLVSLFIQAVRRYLSGSKKSAYMQVADAGALIGGRLDIARTVRLRARGASHQAAFNRTVLSADLPFNRCVYAALREIERLGSLAKVPHADVAMARALRLGLSECLPGVLSMTPRELSEIAAEEAEKRQTTFELYDVISLAGAVLDAAGFGGVDNWKRSVEHSWFVNLETFFEQAIRSTISHILEGVATVTSAKQRPSLFKPDSQRYRANPDIIISDVNGIVMGIGDAKYKDFSDWPNQADVYELVAHAAAYGATKAILFYLGDGNFSVRSFGTSATGCQVWAVGLRFDSFVEDARSALVVGGLFTHQA